MSKVILGIKNIDKYEKLFKGKRVGLITNPTGIDSNFKSSIDILREKTNLALENGSTLVDSTNLSEKSRARLLNYIKTECAAIVVLFMDTTVSTALKRNALRKKREKVPDEELIRMYSRIEIPCNNGEDINYLVTIAENNEIKITKIKEAAVDDLFIKRLAF